MPLLGAVSRGPGTGNESGRMQRSGQTENPKKYVDFGGGFLLEAALWEFLFDP